VDREGISVIELLPFRPQPVLLLELFSTTEEVVFQGRHVHAHWAVFWLDGHMYLSVHNTFDISHVENSAV